MSDEPINLPPLPAIFGVLLSDPKFKQAIEDYGRQAIADRAQRQAEPVAIRYTLQFSTRIGYEFTADIHQLTPMFSEPVLAKELLYLRSPAPASADVDAMFVDLQSKNCLISGLQSDARQDAETIRTLEAERDEFAESAAIGRDECERLKAERDELRKELTDLSEWANTNY